MKVGNFIILSLIDLVVLGFVLGNYFIFKASPTLPLAYVGIVSCLFGIFLTIIILKELFYLVFES